jgi:hypothetical protein
MPLKKSTRSKVSAAPKKSSAATGAKKSTKHQFGAAGMLIAAMCVTGAVIVIAAHGRTPARAMATDAQPDETASVAGQPQPTATTMKIDAPAVAMTSTTEAPDSKATAASSVPVTIFGCLERSNDTYRLTDTDGADAPKARSWKTGFFKKGAASLEVVDPANRARLSNQVGHRVGVTGTLTDRQLQVRSIRRISSSCGN